MLLGDGSDKLFDPLQVGLRKVVLELFVVDRLNRRFSLRRTLLQRAVAEPFGDRAPLRESVLRVFGLRDVAPQLPEKPSADRGCILPMVALFEYRVSHEIVQAEIGLGQTVGRQKAPEEPLFLGLGECFQDRLVIQFLEDFRSGERVLDGGDQPLGQLGGRDLVGTENLGERAQAFAIRGDLGPRQFLDAGSPSLPVRRPESRKGVAFRSRVPGRQGQWRPA